MFMKRFRRSIGIAGLALTLGVGASHADTFTVTTTADSGVGSLRDAITQANGLGGSHTINFGVSGAINLGSALPTINATIDINAAGQTIAIDGSGAHRPFTVNGSGDLTLQSVTVQNGLAADVGGGTFAGGAVYVDGGSARFTARNSTFQNNTAGSWGGAIFNQNGSTVILEDSTVRQNNAVSGGGVLTLFANATYRNSLVTNNTALQGGGMLVFGAGTLNLEQGASVSGNRANFDNQGSPSADTGVAGGLWVQNGVTFNVNNASIDNNHADDLAGGIHISSAGPNVTATINQSTVNGNTAGNEGGGIWNTLDTTLVIQNSELNNNVVSGTGGAIYFENSSSSTGLTIDDSTLDGNEAGFGGGIFLANVNLTLTDSTVSNNTADAFGGGIATQDGNGDVRNLLIENSTITGNTAGADGGGLRIGDNDSNVVLSSTITDNTANNGGGVAAPNGISFGNSIIAENTATNAGDNLFGNGLNSLGHNLFNDAPGSFTPDSTDLLNANPDLLALADNGGPTFTHALGVNSDAIDNGQTSQPVDQRGYFRPAGLADDIGAFEFGAVIPEPATLALLGLGGVACLSRPKRDRSPSLPSV